MWDNDNHELLGLTCAHVAAPFGAKIDDPIYQPGPLDIRAQFRREPNESDVAGHLIRRDGGGVSGDGYKAGS